MEAKSKVTVKSLSTKFSKFSEENKNLKEWVKSLEKKIENSEKRIKVLEEKCNQAEEPYKAVAKDVSPKTKFNYKTCEESFEVKKNLRVHMLEKHPQKVKCKDCHETFDKSCDLEVHIEVHHKLTRQFECEKCEKKFVLQWRLKKHQQFHITQNTKSRHYFNNKKVCPFEDLGCMFDHALSGMCKYGKV
jgi:hypothetical protein